MVMAGSLRQRGQRASEATNEGGYYGRHPEATSLGGYYSNCVDNNQSPQLTRRSSSSSASAGFYNPSGYAPPPTPSSSGAPGFNSGNQSTPAPANQFDKHLSYPNTAPPSYSHDSQGAYNQSTATTTRGLAPRALDGPAAGYSGGSSYGGYVNANAGIGGAPSSANNPYQSAKLSSSGFSLKSFFFGLMVITLLLLTGTTVHFRNLMKSTQVELNDAKDYLEKKTLEQQQQKRTGGRYAQGRIVDRRTKNNEAGAKDLEEKQQLEDEVKRLQEHISSHQGVYNELNEKHASKTTALQDLTSKKQELLKTIDHNTNTLSDTVDETAKYKAMVDGVVEVEAYMKKREGALWGRIGVLERKIARESWREAEEWFGPGPHKVELEVEYPQAADPDSDTSSWPRVRGQLVIEMAPLDLMPHTVNLFLQQVHHELWDGCSVVSNAQHIFQLGPSYSENDLSEDPMHYDKFHEKGLDKVSFQEYSKDYPHGQWTVGLAGRPGGPDFYINKLDNTLIHGPGGQTNSEDLHNEADPCFGKIVDGTAVLEDIGKVPTNAERNNEISYPVVIIRAKVLVHNDNPAEGWREIKSGEKFDGGDGIMPLPDVPHGT